MDLARGHGRLVRRLLWGVALLLGAYVLILLAGSGASPTAAETAVPAAPGASQGSPVASASQSRTRKRKKSRRILRFKYSRSQHSSPIVLSRDGRLLWVVNPGADTVSVISTATNSVIRTIRVGREPQSVAVDPNNRYAFVANAASSNVTVIRITRAIPRLFRARVERRLVTGAEPWNIVASPDGRRVFVANSGQDTVTVIDAVRPRIIGHVDLRRSVCGDPDRARAFVPRGLAITRGSTRLYVTSFFATTRPGGRQADDTGKQGTVCRLSVRTTSRRIRDYRPAARINLAGQVTGFKVDATGDGVPDDTSAFPNQLQSIVVRGNQAYLPNIAASPDGPLRFNVDTHAFVNVIDGIREPRERDAGAAKFLNLHLGAREPEVGKKRLFFANVWAIDFTNRSGQGNAYVVSAGSDLLVKLNVAADGKLSFTVDENTTRYIDLNDPANPATARGNAGKNPQGIVINSSGTRAYTMNFVSRNVSVVDLTQDRVLQTIRTASLPDPGTKGEVVAVGAEMFFSSRGEFNRPADAAVPTSERLSSEGWQSCSSCHFKGLTDGVVWEFGAGPRKSVPLNASFDPRNRAVQRVLNYSAIFDEIEDFEANIRNVSGPGNLATPAPCDTPAPGAPPTSAFDPAHGLLIGDSGNVNLAPCVINQFPKPNADRPQLTATLPGSTIAVPALTALREWVREAVRTPNGPVSNRSVRGGISLEAVMAGRSLFADAGCASCHGGSLWTRSVKDFASPPAAEEIFTERMPMQTFGNPVPLQYLNRFLRDIGSFNLGVPGSGNEFATNIGATEKAAAGLAPPAGSPPGTPPAAQPAQDGLGIDYNGDGKGTGFSAPSLLGIRNVPPYYHNGACESLACVVGNAKHRTANGTLPDRLQTQQQRDLVVLFLRSISASTNPFP
jgi:YVTN family beta-propeller protein